MSLRSRLIKRMSPVYNRNVALKKYLVSADSTADNIKNVAANIFPKLIQPDPRSLFISLTADCNLRCMGCNYGRDFMPGHSLSLEVVKNLLDDAKAIGFDKIRFYGGEPLLHKQLPEMIRHAEALGLDYWVTTNAVLLKRRIDELYEAGLRRVTVGFYGTGKEYDDYVQRKEQFSRVEESIRYTREKYGDDISLGLDWVLMKPTCNLESLNRVWKFAEKYNTKIGVNLVHYSLPYFNEGEDRKLQFTPDDADDIQLIVEELARLKKLRPDLLPIPGPALRSVPDWLLKGPDMKVPCNAGRLIWIGADGSVQLCYVTFKLGNLNEQRLSELVFTDAHRNAAQNAFKLDCPNCHCGYDKRILGHLPSRLKYLEGSTA